MRWMVPPDGWTSTSEPLLTVGLASICKITLCLGLYAAVAVGGGLVLRSIRVSAQFRFNVNGQFLFSFDSFQMRE